jgi:ABC-type Zn uptake system ZnuABC Zn-binding protein ZnuA
VTLLLLSLLASACGAAGGSAPGDGRAAGVPSAATSATTSTEGRTDGETLTVVATFSILGDLVSNVAGDRVEIATLVGPGADAHTFEPSPADNQALLAADLVFENGLGFETWLDDLYESSGSEARRVVVTEGIEGLIGAGEHEEEETHEAAHGGEEGHAGEQEHEDGEEHAEEAEGTAEADHADEDADHQAESGQATEEEDHAAEDGEDVHGEYDPHVWHDVTNAIHMVERIRDALTEADPRNAAVYRANAERYIGELRELDETVRERTSALPEERRKLVTSHDTFGYFAQRYGFEIVDTALGVTTEESEPSAAEIAQLIREIEEAGVPAVFTENVSNPGVMERVAQETGAEVAPPLYTDALGEPGSEGGTYLEMVRYNADTIVEALGE